MTSQRTKRSRLVLSDDEEEYQIDADQYESSTQRVKIQPMTTDWDEEELQRKVKDVVRYALSCEYQRKTIRREDLYKRLHDKKTYTQVIELAKQRLIHVFGMELVELPASKEKMNQSQTQIQSSQLQHEQDTQSTQVTPTQKRGGASGLYVLRSIIKEQYRTPDIITRSEEEYKSTGLLYVILGLIFLGGQTMASPDLYGHLDRLKVTKNEDRDKHLDNFIKNGYLRRSKVKDTEGDELEYIFSWGPRASVELGHAGVVEFLLSFYNLSEEQKEPFRRKLWTQAGYKFSDSK